MTMGDGFKFAAGVVLLSVFLSLGNSAIRYVGLDGLGPRDDSDGLRGHSGLVIRSDHFSGCEYLETWSGQITPRMDREGKQVCRGLSPN